MKDTVLKIARCVLAGVLLAGGLYLLVQCIHDNRTVATMEGNRLYYNGQVYTISEKSVL